MDIIQGIFQSLDLFSSYKLKKNYNKDCKDSGGKLENSLAFHNCKWPKNKKQTKTKTKSKKKKGGTKRKNQNTNKKRK